MHVFVWCKCRCRLECSGGVDSKGGSNLRTQYAWLVRDGERAVAIRGGGGISNEAKADICLGCLVLGLKGSNSIYLPSYSNAYLYTQIDTYWIDRKWWNFCRITMIQLIWIDPQSWWSHHTIYCLCNDWNWLGQDVVVWPQAPWSQSRTLWISGVQTSNPRFLNDLDDIALI